MRHFLKKLVPSVLIALLVINSSMTARAQTYQIDCAILLCLSGGWPGSAPCIQARAEFIRRVTPWPIEPPLQIWRCPMGAAHVTYPPSNQADHIIEAGFQPLARNAGGGVAGNAFTLIQDRADIDIGGPEFSFLRHLRVFHVRNARQFDSGDDGDCDRAYSVRLGQYGPQGEFSWEVTSPISLPVAHSGLEVWGEDCPTLFQRSVFVEWRDYQGNYGFEQIDY